MRGCKAVPGSIPTQARTVPDHRVNGFWDRSISRVGIEVVLEDEVPDVHDRGGGAPAPFAARHIRCVPYVEDGVKDLAQGTNSRASRSFRGGDIGLYAGPLGIG